MEMLVAEVMHQSKIGVRIRSSLGSWHEMMGLEFFTREETLPTDRTHVPLSRGDGPLAGRQIIRFSAGAGRPRGPQRRVIRRGGAAHDHMPFDLEPLELEEIGADRWGFNRPQ